MTDIKDLTTPDTLVDINDISVNKDLPKPERLKEYIRQIKTRIVLSEEILSLRQNTVTKAYPSRIVCKVLSYNFLRCSPFRDKIYYGKRIEYKINSILFDFADKP